MAAKPIERFVKRQIEDQGGWPRILERIESGETITRIAHSFLRPDGLPISLSFFSRLLHQDAKRSEQVLPARIKGADALVDQAVDVVDNCAPERDHIAKARQQADTYLRVAALRDRENFGERLAPTLQINVASLHLDSLRNRAADELRRLGSGDHIATQGPQARVETDVGNEDLQQDPGAPAVESSSSLT